MRVLSFLSALVLLTSFTSQATAQGGVTRFCSSGAGGATLFATGSAEFGVNGGSGDLVLTADGLPGGATGIFLQSAQAQPPTPLGAGVLCLGGGAPIWRLGVVPTGGGSAVQALDYLAPPNPAAQITPGSTWNFQFWFRTASTTDTSDALRIDFLPPNSLAPVVEILHSTHSSHPLGNLDATGGVVVMNTAQELRDFWDLHTAGAQPQPPLPSVDMSRNTLIAVFIGRRLTSGYDVEVTDVSLSVTSLHVSSDETIPCGGVLFTETNPMVVLAVRKVPGAVLGAWTPTTLGCP